MLSLLIKSVSEPDTRNIVLVSFLTESIFLTESNKLPDGIHHNEQGYQKVIDAYILLAVIDTPHYLDDRVTKTSVFLPLRTEPWLLEYLIYLYAWTHILSEIIAQSGTTGLHAHAQDLYFLCNYSCFRRMDVRGTSQCKCLTKWPVLKPLIPQYSGEIARLGVLQ
jgi:hypothetical protein